MELHDADTLARRTTRATLVTRVAVVTAVMLLGAILYLLVTVSEDTNRIVTGVESQQDANTTTVQNVKDTLALLRDCVQPGGECFRNGQERTAEAVGNIGRLSVYAAACAADPVRFEQTLQERADAIERCVTRLVERTSP